MSIPARLNLQELDKFSSVREKPTTSTRLSVSGWRVRLLIDFAEAQGMNAVDALRLCDVDCGILDNPDARVPVDNFLRLCELLGDCTGTTHIGLHLGAQTRPWHLGPYGFTLLSCGTTRELLQQFVRYSALSNNAGRVSVEERGPDCVLCWRSFLDANTPGTALLDDLVLASWTTMRRLLDCNAGAPPLWASFRHSAPADLAAYEDVFRCELRFDADEAALAFSINNLDEKLPQGNPQVFAVMSSLCHRLRRRLGDLLDPAWLTECRRIIIDAFRNGDPDIANVAGVLGISPDELRKRFRQHSLSFRTFTDDLRLDLAQSYLDDATLQLVDVAHLLGFSEQSAFQRAFKRWTGKTPGEYRRRV